MSRHAQPIPPGCQIYALEHLWWGISIGGKHYTGSVKWNDNGEYRSVELDRRLTLREAKELGDTQVILWTERHTRVTNRFDTLEQLEREAVRWVRAETKRTGVKNWLLLENDRYNPNRPLAAQGWYKGRMKMMEDLAAAWDKVPNHLRETDKELWDEVYQLWYALLTPPAHE